MKSDSTKARHSRWSILLAILTAIIGIGLSLYARSRVAQVDATQAQLTAETLRENTQQELELFGEVLESVGALHALSDAVDQAAMDEFIKKGMVHQHSILGSFGLAQRIGARLRAEIEAKERLGPGAYTLVQRGTDGSWVPSEDRSAYYPLTWQSHAEKLNIPVGFDFASENEALQTIHSIERTRRPALVPAAVPQRTEDSPSNQTTQQLSPIGNRKSEIVNPRYWVFAPVIPHRFKSLSLHRSGTVIGFSVAVLHPENILDRVSTPSGLSPELHLSLLNPDKPETNQTLRRFDGTWHYCHSLEALDAQWMFECILPVSSSAHRSALALTFGLIITALMTSQLLLLSNRTRKIEVEVRARTEELRLANAHLEENLHERARMEEEMQALSARERRRIGRDLHDSLGQKLTGAVFLSRSLMDYLSKKGISNIKNAPALTHAKTLNETLKSAVAQVRSMARGLAPVALNDESLGDALQQLAEEMTALYGVSCELTECNERAALDRKTKEQLYLIAREAVNNAARHAEARQITVQLTGTDSNWALCIADDGKGLPAATPAHPVPQAGRLLFPKTQNSGLKPHPSPLPSGMGIRIMRHRARLIDAAFNIQATPDQGTTVSVGSQTS